MSQSTAEGTRRSQRIRRTYDPHALDDIVGSEWQRPRRPVTQIRVAQSTISPSAPSAGLYTSRSTPKVTTKTVPTKTKRSKKFAKVRPSTRQFQWSDDDDDALAEDRLLGPPVSSSRLNTKQPKRSSPSSFPPPLPPSFITHITVPPIEANSQSDLSDEDTAPALHPEHIVLNANESVSSTSVLSNTYFIDDPNIHALSPEWRAIRDFDVHLLSQHRLFTFKNVYHFGNQLCEAYGPIASGIENNLFDSNPTQYCEPRLSLWLRLKILFAPMLLRYNSSLNIIKARLQLFRTKQWATLLRDLSKDLRQPQLVQQKVTKKYGKGTSDPSNLNYRYKLAEAYISEDGDISKAYNIITSPTKYDPPTAASVEYLRSLHPPQLPNNIVPPALKKVPIAVALPDITNNVVYAAIKKMKNGRKPGLDGLRKEHLLAMSKKGSAPWLRSEGKLASAVAAGLVPLEYRTLLTSTVLIGLPKPGEPFRRRPIGINSTWLKLVDNALLSFLSSDIRKLLAPFQFGLEPSGPESLIQCIRETMRAQPGWIVLKLDVQNAFNTVSRKTIFSEIHDLFPQLIPYLNLVYGQHRDCWTVTETGATTRVSSEEGVTQGHVLGPALFNIATYRPVLIKLNQLLNPANMPSRGRVLALHDDTFLIMDPYIVPNLWPEILSTFEAVGLSINLGPAKSSLYIPPTIPITTEYLASLPADLTVTREGIRSIGVPLGSDEFCENFWDENLVNKVREAIPLVCQFQDTQKALTLFRLCINTKQNYCLRMTDPNAPYSSRLTNKLQVQYKLALAYLLNKKAAALSPSSLESCITDRIWCQATLPAKNGGLSIIDPILTHHPAFIAAQIAATLSYQRVTNILNAMSIVSEQRDIRDIISLCPLPTQDQTLSSLNPDVTRAFTQFKASVYQLQIDGAIRAQEPNNINNDLSILSLITVSDKIKIQKHLMQIRYAHINRKIRLTWPSRDINRLNSASNEGAIPITVLPTLKEFCISADTMFAEILSYRLGIPYSFTPTGTCTCGAPLSLTDNQNHYHVQSVCSHTNHRQTKHNAIRDVLIQLFRNAGFIAKPEPVLVNLDNPTSKERLDVLVDNYTPGKSLYIDVSVTDVLQQKYNTGTSPAPVAIGKAAEDREETKTKDHGPSCQRLDSYFAPFVIEQAGNWGNKARELFNNVITHLIQRRTGLVHDSSDSTTKRYYKAKIMMAYFRASCISFHRRCDAIKRARQSIGTLNINEDYNEYPYNTIDIVNPTLVAGALN